MKFIDIVTIYANGDDTILDFILNENENNEMWFAAPSKIFNSYLHENIENIIDKEQKKEVANQYITEFLDLLHEFKNGGYYVEDFPANTPLIKFFVNYLENKMKEYWRKELSNKPEILSVNYEEGKEDKQGNYLPSPYEQAAYQDWEREGQGPQNTNTVTVLLENPVIMQEFESMLKPLQVNVFRELLDICKNNYEVIENNIYKKLICQGLGKYYKGKEYYQLIDKELNLIKNKFIKLCNKYGVDITAYLKQDVEQVNLKRSNYQKVKKLLEYIKGKPLMKCSNNILKFYNQQKQIEIKNKGIYSYQEHNTFEELLDFVEFNHLPQVHKCVENKEYFYGLDKKEQYLILNQLHNALIKFEKIYKKYDDIEKINYEIA